VAVVCGAAGDGPAAVVAGGLEGRRGGGAGRVAEFGEAIECDAGAGDECFGDPFAEGGVSAGGGGSGGGGESGCGASVGSGVPEFRVFQSVRFGVCDGSPAGLSIGVADGRA